MGTASMRAAPVEPVRAAALPAVSTAAVTWPAIFAGALAAAAVSIVLLLLGSGIGLSAASPWPNAGPSAQSLGRGAAAWVVVVQWGAAAFGGYLAGRLRTRWAGVAADEVFFRDTAHGFLAWALATLAAFAIAALAVSATAVAAGEDVAARPDTEVAAVSGTDPYFIDRLFRSARAPLAGRLDLAREEASRIIARRGDGEAAVLSSEDEAYLAGLVARETGAPEQEAAQRVRDTLAAVAADDASRRGAADEARKAAAKLSLLTTLSLVVGAFIASVAGAIGGRKRDDDEDARAAAV